jgi:hypothetical protein
MVRLLWYLVIAAFVGALLVGASYAAAYSAVGTLLGAPPPKMGNRSAELLWKGAPELAGHPRAWRFTFGPTMIPGATSVKIWVSPTGRLLRTEPADLPGRLAGFHDRGI